jgi:hypothetical protein
MQFESSFLLPSAVFADTDGRLLVGRDAERSARLDPASFEPNPKRRIDDGVVLLGSREYPVPDVIAAVLRRVVDEASRVVGQMPGETVLTYPANWAGSRKGVLAEAAARAGVPAVTLVPEPVAAAVYFTKELGHTVPSGSALVVYDFGGGTFDTTVLRRASDTWEILATDGVADLGGLDLDGAIVDHLSRTIGTSDPDRWHRLVHPEDDLARRRHLMLWADARAAKEQLSRSSSAAIHVPLFDVDTHLTREEFERVARPYLERTVDLTMAALQRAGVRQHEVGGVFPVGGSSRIPLASTLLHQRVGVGPTLIEDPELVVALGSLRAIAPTVHAFVARDPESSAWPTSPAPAGAPTSPASPASPTSPAAAATPTSPTSPGFAASPTSPAYAASPTPPGYVPPMRPDAAMPPERARRNGRIGAIAAAVVLALVVCVGLPLWNAISNQFDGARGQQPGPTGTGTGAGKTQAGARVQTAKVNKTVWYAGLKLTFGEARYDAAADPQVTVDVNFENLSKDPYWGGDVKTTFRSGNDFFPGEAVLAADVPAGAKSDGKLVYDVKTLTGSFGEGAFLLGTGTQAQAVVPVGQGVLVDYTPVPIVKDKQVVNRDIKVTFTTCELRADFFVKRRQAEKGNRVFSCLMDAQDIGGRGPAFGRGSMYLLKLPDGNTVGPVVDDFRWLSRAIETNVYVAFTFKWPLPGRYTFQMINKTSSEPQTAANTTEISFTLDASQSPSTP